MVPLRFQQDFHDVFLLGVGEGGGGFVQRERARNQGAWIDFGFAEQPDGFGKRAAAGADDCDFLYDDGPGFDGGRAVECGFQDQRSARFGDVLSEGQACRRAGGFDDQRKIFFYFF